MDNFINNIISIKDTIILMTTQALLFILILFFARIIAVKKSQKINILKKIFLLDSQFKEIIILNILFLTSLIILEILSVLNIIINSQITSILIKVSIILFYITGFIYSLKLFLIGKSEK
ncbi:MAG: hypothetical protein ACI4TZ_03775 [Christensenellales bacterium]